MEEFIKLAIKHCMSDDDLKAINAVGEEDAKIVLGDLNKLEVTAEPITFYSRDFATIAGFPKAMFKAADFFIDTDDVVVRYAKPEDKETHEVLPCFQIFRSKGKILHKYIKENGKIYSCLITSNKDLKSAIKFFNSLGIKGEEGENLNSISEELKAELNPDNGEFIYIEIDLRSDEDGNEYLALVHGMVYSDFEDKSYDTLKEDMCKLWLQPESK